MAFSQANPDMLDALRNVRRLLTSPDSGNIQNASTELGDISVRLAEFSDMLSAQREMTAFDATYLQMLRSELSAIRVLSQTASDYFNRLGSLRVAGFGAYERTGVLRSLDTGPRTLIRI
jgi:hypothetical protein